jgi:hypothetical protein
MTKENPDQISARILCPNCLLNGIYRWYDQCSLIVKLVPIIEGKDT